MHLYTFVQTECVLEVLYIGYGTDCITNDHLTKIYAEGKIYLDVEQSFTKEQTMYYNHELYSDAEVITLNGSYVSSLGTKPKAYSYTDGTYKLNKTKLFKYDHKLQRHTFGSFSDYSNYDTIKNSMLAYNFTLGTIGSVNVYAKPSSEYSSAKRTILGFVYGEARMLDLFIDDCYELKYSINGMVYSSGLKLNFDEWNMVTILWQSNQIQVSVNNSPLNTKQTVNINLSGTTLYVGSSATGNGPLNHFEGQLQMLTVWDTNIPSEKINDIFDDGLQLSVQTEFDINGRIKAKNIIANGDVLKKKYQYFDEKYNDNNEDKQKYNPLPTSELDIDGNEIVYVYDEYLNVTSKETITSTGKPISVTRYEYDGFKRLSKETQSFVSIDETNPEYPIRIENFDYSYEYKYDSNGNILYKTSLDDNDQVRFKDTYHYSLSIKDRLDRVSRLENSVELDIYSFAYNTNDQFRPSAIIKEGQTNSLSWSGPRLMQYGSTHFTYNESGLRIKKMGTNIYVKYELDGSKIIKSTDEINSKTIDYHFDQHDQVVGFRFSGKEFLYQRNILGEIYGIIGTNGKQFVKYEYTAFGIPTITIGSGLDTNEHLIAQTISEQNIYLYKGYVYDPDTELYYCQTRYYEPKLGRWISIDDINFLDTESINGLNLFAYCNNNPIMRYDSNGNLSTFWKIV